MKSAWKLDEFESPGKNVWAGAVGKSSEMEFRNKLTWLRDHHRGVMMGSVTAAAPYGTSTISGISTPIHPKNTS